MPENGRQSRIYIIRRFYEKETDCLLYFSVPAGNRGRYRNLHSGLRCSSKSRQYQRTCGTDFSTGRGKISLQNSRSLSSRHRRNNRSQKRQSKKLLRKKKKENPALPKRMRTQTNLRFLTEMQPPLRPALMVTSYASTPDIRESGWI